MKTFLRNVRGLEVASQWEPNCWIKIECPDAEDYNYLINTLKVPEFFLSDIADIDERPRVETEDEWTFIILRIPHRQDDSKVPFITVPLGIIFKDNICVSVCHYQTNMLKDIPEYYQRKNIGFTDTVDLIFKLFLSSSVWYLKSLKLINQRIEVVKRDLERSIENRELLSLFHLESCLTFFITSLKGNEILLSKLKFKLPVDELDVELIEDVEIELKQAHESANIYSNILSGMMDAYSSIISNNVNSIMRVLTSISIILMVPTLISSMFGMNIKNGVENSNWAFICVFGLSILLCVGFFWVFRKRRWL
jgi:magnesium transporter